MRLNRQFFNRDTITVARELLGKYLVRKIGGKLIAGRIIETEAYCGPKDLACHASKGRTKRTEAMFGPAGFAYVYIVYGMYHCLNVVTGEEGHPAAVLIRGCELSGKYQVLSSKYKNQKPIIYNTNSVIRKLDGPGKLCRELGIDRNLNGADLCAASGELWLEDREERVPSRDIKKAKRVGVDYAGKWKDKLWRFHL